MKQILTIMIVLMAICVHNTSAQQAKIMLQHNGIASLFEKDGLQMAIDASVDGDTIYVPGGLYNSTPVTITKKISIIGQGKITQIGNVTIDIPEGSEMNSTILCGLMTGAVYINCSVSKLHIDKCSMHRLSINPKSSKTKTFVLKDLLVERCYIPTLEVALNECDSIDNCIIQNCGINNFNNKCKNSTLVNCTIGASDVFEYYKSQNKQSYIYGNYINCIIKRKFCGQYSEDTYTTYKGTVIIDGDALFLNCLMGYDPSVSTSSNLYIDDSFTQGQFTDDDLKARGYLGTDGTVVGYNGGIRPFYFDITPPVPMLEDIKMDVNYATKKLNVTVKVKAN